ncbi:unnamed protein product [Microthlaspi erraticum]|uniref:Uncharacterized protein n=1 Tax=Microthlaspi erraticum TaxID=1685480 RepID=A0A6D2I6R2_9BRAS|nr:unnamed protein product [Microthlaspi erraticum]
MGQGQDANAPQTPSSDQSGLLEHFGAYGTRGAKQDLAHGRSSTGYAKEEGVSHLEDQLDHLLGRLVQETAVGSTQGQV